MEVLRNARFLTQQVFPSLMKSVIKKERGFARSSMKPKVGILREKKNVCNELLHVPSLVEGKVTVLLIRYFPC